MITILRRRAAPETLRKLGHYRADGHIEIIKIPAPFGRYKRTSTIHIQGEPNLIVYRYGSDSTPHLFKQGRLINPELTLHSPNENSHLVFKKKGAAYTILVTEDMN
ncbi:hypothetical protein Q9Q95_14145 [Sphingomonas sp. DG1-23]|uniref:hypothetical protein n=1 Tax=Sphingomonas sp. DG1-23 TaxID=3068316 RepID=UPI00273CFD90|nr:hypothetical protein [Sphingomonas sp. DG1-23]MDP5280071.1 hypothetical protein [Sphingomonas sp. DG1-23]